MDAVIKNLKLTPWMTGVVTLVFLVCFMFGFISVRSGFMLCCSAFVLLFQIAAQVYLYARQKSYTLRSWVATLCLLIFVVSQCFMVFSPYNVFLIGILQFLAYITLVHVLSIVSTYQGENFEETTFNTCSTYMLITTAWFAIVVII
ncbi:MAG: hypothetical protein IJS05_00715 [Paludibacteraceae bacterium]|nr:hypothetical protein [Paludibacteraceae bacterium]